MTWDIRDRRLAKVAVSAAMIYQGRKVVPVCRRKKRRAARCSVRRCGNDHLREITSQDFTAKDFRTWAGTVMAAMALREFKKFDTKAEAKKNVVAAIESVAKRLGNTPAVCRKCYIHPHVFDSYLDGRL